MDVDYRLWTDIYKCVCTCIPENIKFNSCVVVIAIK